MFTGIITAKNTILEMMPCDAGIRLRISTKDTDLQLGESISIDGMCVTVTSIDQGSFTCDLSPETLDKTIASTYQVNTIVNCERALAVGARLGGHFVSGHVDRQLTVSLMHQVGEFTEYRLTGFTAVERGLLIAKGSIAINGVSLTINAVTDNDFSVMIIPHTMAGTNIDKLQVGSNVNIEFDMLAKMTAQQLALRVNAEEVSHV